MLGGKKGQGGSSNLFATKVRRQAATSDAQDRERETDRQTDKRCPLCVRRVPLSKRTCVRACVERERTEEGGELVGKKRCWVLR